MTISWIVFAAPLLFFTYRGYRQGIWAAASRLLSLGAAYVVALVFSTRIAPVIENYTMIQGMAAYISAGLGLFFFTALILGFILSLLGKLLQQQSPGKVSSAFGALMGFGIGAVVGLVAVFGLSYLSDVWPTKSLAQAGPPTAIERLARYSAKQLATWFGSLSPMDPTMSKLSAALVSEPRRVISHVQNLQQNDDVRDLFSNPAYRSTLRSGDSEAVRKLPAFQNLVANQDIQALAAVSGMEKMGPEQEVQLAEQMQKMWLRAEQIKNDPHVRAIVSNPEFQQQLQSGNPLTLINNKDFMTLLGLLTNAPVMPSQMTGETNNEEETTTKEVPVYRWVDDDGNVHYSDRPPQVSPTP